MNNGWPMDWTYALLGEIADVNWGDTSVTKASYVPKGFVAYSASGPDGFLPYAEYDRIGVVISAIGAECGSTWLTKGKWSCIKNTMRFWSKNPEVDTRFLYWLTRNKALWPKRGSAQPFIAQADARAMEVAFPRLDVQKGIADTLGALDDKIELNRRMNATLEAMAQAVFKEWFVDGAKDTWKRGKLSDLCEVVDFVANGSFASLKANVQLYDEPEYALYVRTTDYTGGFTGSLKYTDKASFDFLKKSRLHGDEVIISNVGNTGTVFRPPVWLGKPMTLGSNAVALLSKTNAEYLFHYFRSKIGQNAIDSIVTGSAQPKFNKTNLRGLEMVVPDDATVQSFEGFAKGIKDSIANNQLQTATLSALRDTLLPKLMRGEVRVKSTKVNN